MCPLRVFFALLQLHLLFMLGLGGSPSPSSGGSAGSSGKRSCPFRHFGAFRGAGGQPPAFVPPSPASLASQADTSPVTAEAAARPAPFTLTVPPVRCAFACGGWEDVQEP